MSKHLKEINIPGYGDINLSPISGTYKDYDPEIHKDMLYISKDTSSLLFNGLMIGVPTYEASWGTEYYGHGLYIHLDESVRNSAPHCFIVRGYHWGDKDAITMFFCIPCGPVDDVMSRILVMSANSRSSTYWDLLYNLFSWLSVTLHNEKSSIQTYVTWSLVGTSLLDQFSKITHLSEDLSSLRRLLTSFLSDLDSTDATINKWKELESFLLGISDTETLMGLFQNITEKIDVLNDNIIELLESLTIHTL